MNIRMYIDLGAHLGGVAEHEEPRGAVLAFRQHDRARLQRACVDHKSSFISSSSSLISSVLHSHVNLEWCDKIKLSKPLLPRKSACVDHKPPTSALSNKL